MNGFSDIRPSMKWDGWVRVGHAPVGSLVSVTGSVLSYETSIYMV